MFAETPAIYIIPSSFWDFPYTRFWLGSLPDLVSVSGSLNFTLPSKKKKMRFGYPGSAPPERIITASNGARFIIRDYALGDPNFRRGKYPCVIYLWWQCGLFYASGRTYLLCWIL
uniref:Uncharacterized protein n=4 Tax=Gallid alphaherpesvirus 2 TaxID=10390 RepID=Q159H3_9ALPH|nr:hypothetical protein MDV075.5 [Gallid alphaherpesvirus 2]ABG22994.1 hypothetical protein MDV075.5 [Gallid alphaherpesvirus 2]